MSQTAGGAWNIPPPPGTETSATTGDGNGMDNIATNRLGIPLSYDPVSSSYSSIESNSKIVAGRDNDSDIRQLATFNYNYHHSSETLHRGGVVSERLKKSKSSRWSRSKSPSSHRHRSKSRDREHRSRRRHKYGRRRSRSRSKSPRRRSHSRGRRYRSRSRSHSRSGSRSRHYRRRHRYSKSASRSPSHSKSHRHRHRSSSRNSHSSDKYNNDRCKSPEQEEEEEPMTKENAFKNDGSFLEMFKKMQEEQKAAEEAANKEKLEESVGGKKPVPVFGKRRGGRVLKTGLVQKTRIINEKDLTEPQDAWSVYMKEVKRYKEACCDDDSKTRPLVK